jgi:hypothetical protein
MEVKLDMLTDEQKKELFCTLLAEEEARLSKREEDRATFKALKDEAVREMFSRLKELSNSILEAKNLVFSRFDTIRDMKDDLYRTKSGRNTDTFSTEDNRITVKLGNRVYEGWDDTVEVGIQKVRDYLKTMARDDNSAALVDTVMGLLAKDRKGNLKASKVLDLEKLAKKSGDAEFIDGLEIIKAAYRPSPSCQFVEVRYKDHLGREYALPLSISAFDVPGRG